MSSNRFHETIVAPITGSGPAAIAVIRISGAASWEVAAHVFSPWPASPKPRYALYGQFSNGDDGIALPFAEGQSYTGEGSVELSVHGSSASVRSLIEACLTAGARMAEPGEFTLRAFLSGRIDLTQAEAVRDSVEALTQAQLRRAASLREGSLRGAIHRSRLACVSLLAAVEASVDFSEEIGDLDQKSAQEQVEGVLGEIRALLKTAHTGQIIRSGLRIALVGLPNAGKSSLLNALLKTERAIVTEIPGTTRDTLEEWCELGGIPCILIDTAGMREAHDPIESIGVQRSQLAAAQADWIWYIFDASLGWTKADQASSALLARPMLVIAAKSDLPCSHAALPPDREVHFLSSLTGEGFPDLIQRFQTYVGYENSLEAPYINTRHETHLLKALQALELVHDGLRLNHPDDLLSTGLREAIHAFGQITGETASPDMIEHIFSKFCIGK